MSISLKRAYATPSPRDGYRVLVDRLWPRGVSKENAKIAAWPKNDLRYDQPPAPISRWEFISRSKYQAQPASLHQARLPAAAVSPKP
jgi:uncharacterized protein YeaO (DUF488 family)